MEDKFSAFSRRDAIVISPDYRLLPEASGADILADVDAFWTWMQRELPLLAARESWPACPDIGRVVVLGESSGGYLAVQSALLCSSKVDIKAVISISAPLDGSATMRTMVPGPRMVMGARPPPPRQAQALIRDYVRHRKPGVVRTEGDPLEMWTLLLSLVQQGWMPRLLGISKDARLDPTKSLEGLRAIPPLWIIHSQEDSVVPVACSSDFATVVATKFPSVPMRLTLQVKGDHTFTSSMQMDTPWIREGCHFVNQFWL